MALSVNRLTKVITIPQADLTLITGTLYELDTDAFRLNLKVIEASEEGIIELDMHRHNTSVTVAGTTFARTIEIINGYSIEFENLSYSVRLVGSNNNIFDIQSGILVQNLVQVIPGNSAGLISSAEIADSSFGGGVSLDFIKGTSGTLFPQGNLAHPVNNLADLKVIASNRGLEKMFVKGPFTFGATDNIDSFTVRGSGTVTTDILTFISGASTVNTRFERCTVAGTLKGKIEADGVIFEAIINMDYSSWLLDCWFSSDVTLKGGGTFRNINGGIATPPGVTARPTFDYANVSNAKSSFLRWSGNIGFRNVTAGNIELNIDSGKVFLESNNTGGDIFIRPEHTDIDDETPVGGLVVHGELERFRVLADAGNTATTFKTDLTSTQLNLYKDSIIQVLPTIASGALSREVKKVLAYDGATKFITLTSALSGVPSTNTKMKIINE